MNSKNSDVAVSTFQTFSLFRNDIAVVVSATNADLEERVEASQVHLWHKNKWASLDVPISCVAVATWATKVLMTCYLSHDGTVLTNGGDSDLQGELIDNTDGGPSDLVQMRAIRCIDNSLIAVGMARMAYRKTLPNGSWVKIDTGLFVPREERTTAVGLNDVVSDGEGGLLAVGYKGEIWRMKQSDTWQLESSPTNVYLSSIAKHPNKDEFTVVGLKGVIIKGSPRTGWTIVEILPKPDFWSVVYFNNKTLIASDAGLFTVEADGVKTVDFQFAEPITTRFLNSCKSEVWSVGDQHIFSSLDGVKWEKVPNP
jgi:hypothetical protein